VKRIYTILLALFMLLGLTDSFAKGGFGGGRSSGGGRSFSSSRSSFSSRPSYSGFSSRPSRSFTFGSSSSTTRSTYTRPATSSSFFSRPAPRTKTTIINNHHYGSSGSHSGGSGFGMMDYFMLNSIVNSNHNNGPAYAPQPVIVQQPGAVMQQEPLYQSQGSTVVYQEETHYIRNFFAFVIGCGILYGVYRLVKFGFGLLT
jgi:hypothetical protein